MFLCTARAKLEKWRFSGLFWLTAALAARRPVKKSDIARGTILQARLPDKPMPLGKPMPARHHRGR
jgi:hypothetical protein